MKKILFILFASAIVLSAQFKDELDKPVDIRGGLINQQPNSLFSNIFNPANLSMKHEVSMSYAAGGGNGVALGVYTNTIGYKFTDNLNVEVDASFVNSPYSTYGKEFSDQVNGVYLSRAQINYQPTENTSVIIQYRNLPGGYYSPFSRYRFDNWRSSFWDY